MRVYWDSRHKTFKVVSSERRITGARVLPNVSGGSGSDLWP